MRTDVKDPLQLLTVKEIADQLNLSRGALYQMIARREIPYVKMGRRVRFVNSDILEWLNCQKIRERNQDETGE